jgi:hypothetical protein
MSLQNVEGEIRRFLQSKMPEVLCLSGRWGVGKTFAWKKFLRDAQASHAIGLERYAYVSLFGANSIEELKYAIFENTVSSKLVDAKVDIESLRKHAGATLKRFSRKAAWLVQQNPWLKSHIGGFGQLWYLLVKEMIVCIDDIERSGKGLSVGDVLGVVSALKEQRDCKIVIILNDEALESEKEQFRLYFEKVVDIKLAFSPSPGEAVSIALPDSDTLDDYIRKRCVALGISNIRIIKKIQHVVEQVAPEIKQLV